MINKVSISRNRMFKISVQNLRRKLKGSRFIETDRHGKYLFIGIDNNKWLIIHFGMTGNIYYTEGEADKSILVINFEEGRKCKLWKESRYAVPGEGPADARIMLVGQNPGAKEGERG